MNKNGDIIVIEDDADEREFLEQAFNYVIKENNYSNRLVIIADSSTVVDYIRNCEENPFLVLSDINMPKLDGFELRSRIFEDPELKERCIPYIFITTAGDNEEYIREAYQLSVQGYFSKPRKFPEYKVLANDILKYWKSAKTPTYNKAG
jgi:CheY-like chemotaxis protein